MIIFITETSQGKSNDFSEFGPRGVLSDRHSRKLLKTRNFGVSAVDFIWKLKKIYFFSLLTIFSMPGDQATTTTLQQVQADLFMVLCDNANALLASINILSETYHRSNF
jgi:hypothetical protein